MTVLVICKFDDDWFDCISSITHKVYDYSGRACFNTGFDFAVRKLSILHSLV